MIPIKLTQEYVEYYQRLKTRPIYINPDHIVRYYLESGIGEHTRSTIVFISLGGNLDYIQVLENPDQIALTLVQNEVDVAVAKATAIAART